MSEGIECVWIFLIDYENSPLWLFSCYFSKMLKCFNHCFTFSDLFCHKLDNNLGIGFTWKFDIGKIFWLDFRIVCDDSIMDKMKSMGFIEVRMCVRGDFGSTSCPSCVSDADWCHSSLSKDFINDSINTIDTAITLVSIFDKNAIIHDLTESEDTWTIVASIFEEINSICQKTLDSDFFLGILLDFFLGDRFLRDDADDATALDLFWRHQIQTRQS